jgi:hypothetical protein
VREAEKQKTGKSLRASAARPSFADETKSAGDTPRGLLFFQEVPVYRLT